MIYRPLLTCFESNRKTYHHLLALTQDELVFIKTLMGKSNSEGVDVEWSREVDLIAKEIWKVTEKIVGEDEMDNIEHP